MSTSPSRPLRRDAERNRRLIIDTAKRLFAERGLQVTLDEIAQSSGLGVGTVYRRFPNREALVGALFADRVEEVLALSRRAAEAEPPAAAFRGLITELARLHAEDRALRDVLLADDRAEGPGLGLAPAYRRVPNREGLVGALGADRVEEVRALSRRAAEAEPAAAAFRDLITELARLHAEDRGLRDVLLADDRAGDQFAAA